MVCINKSKVHFVIYISCFEPKAQKITIVSIEILKKFKENIFHRNCKDSFT